MEKLISWYKFSYSRQETFRGHGSELQDEFLKIYMAMLAPESVSLFVSRDVLVDPTMYFVSVGEVSDIYQRIVQTFVKFHNGTPCEKPKHEDVALLVGNSNSWNLIDQ